MLNFKQFDRGDLQKFCKHLRKQGCFPWCHLVVALPLALPSHQPSSPVITVIAHQLHCPSYSIKPLSCTIGLGGSRKGVVGMNDMSHMTWHSTGWSRAQQSLNIMANSITGCATWEFQLRENSWTHMSHTFPHAVFFTLPNPLSHMYSSMLHK